MRPPFVRLWATPTSALGPSLRPGFHPLNVSERQKIVVDLAALVDREGLEAFEERVHQVAAEFPPEYIFDYGGPWAPFSFFKRNP